MVLGEENKLNFQNPGIITNQALSCDPFFAFWTVYYSSLIWSVHLVMHPNQKETNNTLFSSFLQETQHTKSNKTKLKTKNLHPGKPTQNPKMEVFRCIFPLGCSSTINQSDTWHSFFRFPQLLQLQSWGHFSHPSARLAAVRFCLKKGRTDRLGTSANLRGSSALWWNFLHVRKNRWNLQLFHCSTAERQKKHLWVELCFWGCQGEFGKTHNTCHCAVFLFSFVFGWTRNAVQRPPGDARNLS